MMEMTEKDGARYTITTTTTQNAAQTVIVKYLLAALIFYAQWPGLATVKQDRLNYRLVDAAFFRRDISCLEHSEMCSRLNVAREG